MQQPGMMQPGMDTQMMPMGGQQASISLSTVIEFAIQKTFHELTVLAELLPRKTDMERKIEIVQYAHQTRQLFVRLLSLVKWAKNGCKIDKCMAISYYLDKQAMLYIDTANQLSKLARETLVHARLPAFSIPVAVDVLTSGTYPRLPSCIRDKIIPPDPITSDEEQSTLKRLTQIVEFRLVTSDIPHAFKQLNVYNGRVKLVVDKEFSVILTVMGDLPSLPWRLLGIEILVQDSDSRDGKPLVHPMQIQYLHSLVQSRLVDTETPLHELYSVLHSFCQSLQLEVLYSQAQKLMYEQLNSTVSIDLYTPCKQLVVSYWRPRQTPQQQAQTGPTYRIDIHVSESDTYKPLCIRHSPTPPDDYWSQFPHHLKSHQLSIEKIILETVHAWSYARLNELSEKLQTLNTATDFTISDLPPTLTFKVIKPCMEAERVCIAVDCQQGTFLLSLAHLTEQTKALSDLENFLNAKQQNNETLKQLLTNLKLWLGLQRCWQSIQYVRTSCSASLPLVQHSNHPISKLGGNTLFIKVPYQDTLYVVVNVEVLPSEPLTIVHTFYLMGVSPCTYSPDDHQSDILKMYLKPGSMSRIDSKALGLASTISTLMETDDDLKDLESQRKENSCYFVSELISAVNQSELRAEFVTLADQLWSRGMQHQGLQPEESGAACKLTILTMPDFDGEANDINSNLLQCTFRVDSHHMVWVVELLFSKNPISEKLGCHQCLLRYDMKALKNTSSVVEEFISDWRGIVSVYNITSHFMQLNKADPLPVGFYNYSFTNVQIVYGQQKNYLATISWQGEKKSETENKEARYNVVYSMCSTLEGETKNPHYITAQYLDEILNSPNKNLHDFMQVLCETVRPLSSLLLLPELASFGLQHSMKALPVQSFSLLVESASFIRISYRQMFLIDVKLCDNEVVMMRDGSYGLFDSQQALTSYIPVTGLKSFLSKYVEAEQSHFTQGQSMADEDNPPTPNVTLGGLDSLDALLGGPAKLPSPTKPDPSPKPGSAQATAASPAIAPSPLGSFGSPLDVQMTSPALPLSSPAVMTTSPASNSMIAASPGLTFHSQGTPQGFDSQTGFSPKPSWGSSPAQANTLSPRGGIMQQPTLSPLHENPIAGIPTRHLPQRPGVGSVPTVLTHSAFAKILSPGMEMEAFPSSYINCSPFERFLGTVMLKRHLTKIMSSDFSDKATIITSGVEPGTINWTLESLQYKVFLTPSSQMLQMKITPIADQMNLFIQEDLTVLEQYFHHKVVCPPYKANNLLSFCKMLSAPSKVLRDMIQIMRMQMYYDMENRWRVEWCLTLPLEASRRMDRPRMDPGVGAVLVQGEKVFYVLKFTRTGEPQGETVTQFSMAFVYDVATNVLQTTDHSNRSGAMTGNRPELSVNVPINRIIDQIRQNPSICQQQQCTPIYASCLEMVKLVL